MRNKNFSKILIYTFSILFFSFFILFLMVEYSTVDDKLVFELMIDQPFMIFINILPIVFATLFLLGLTGSLGLSFLLNFIIFSLVFLTNRTKILYRVETFKLADLFLGPEAVFMSFKGSYGSDSYGKNIFVICLVAFLFLFFVTRKIKIRDKRFRFAMVALSLLVPTAIFPKIYDSEKIYYNLKVVGNQYNIIDHYSSKGTIYNILYSAYGSKLEKPKGYKKSFYKNLEDKDTSKAVARIKKEKRPHVVWLMGEAFSEISQRDQFVFKEENDPNINYKRIRDESKLWGFLAVNSFGGGTAETEFDVLTGAQSQYFSPKTAASFHNINSPTDSLVSLFKKIGYHTRAFHPGYKWFYGRNHVYRNLGFDEIYFLEDLEKPKFKGDYVSQEQFMDLYLDRLLEDIKNSDQPVFDYAVDIQNHGPYFYDKYKEVLPFETTIELPEKSREVLSSYFIGVKDIDTQLGRLYDRIQELDEPVILVFYGDHGPGLGEGLTINEQLEMTFNFEDFEQEKLYYTTPLVITGNKAGKEYLKTKQVELLSDQTISASFLGSLVLDMLGYTEVDNFFSYNSNIRRQARMFLPNYIYVGEKAYEKNNLPEDIEKKYNEYLGYQYYRIKDK